MAGRACKSRAIIQPRIKLGRDIDEGRLARVGRKQQLVFGCGVGNACQVLHQVRTSGVDGLQAGLHHVEHLPGLLRRLGKSVDQGQPAVKSCKALKISADMPGQIAALPA
ncbi:MAG: hypothetical protein GC146_08600 [Limimaricola sp.]|uniref:hypothetical protein n=1 Tax=Limimaricola sp. TaxID=2211665 RepID=UPI001D6788FF|nr:hypothetical protein [Limimaricola sp.]MBI1417266.1 hypothetical protein [Limimaricola sp.]